ncbi:MAG: response regulator transcription factor [Dehalococcoidales bacterium]|nr:response regulator transcription factor [Dehalococcoidales bacterium]
MPRILVVDDEPHILELTKMYLERDGFQVECVGNGRDALDKMGSSPDFVILDLMLPDIDGFEVCRRIRAKSNVPILMLTARKEDVDKVVGLELGADDYCTKPFNPRELVARVKAILRRYQTGAVPSNTIEIGKLRIDLSRHEVTLAGKPMTLRTKEFALLATLVQNPGIVFSREKLLELVWGYDYIGETRTVDVHVNHLREKLAGFDVSIETLRGAGYKIVAREEDK